MRYKLIIRQEAHLDASEAYTYYEEKSPGLGERFLQELVKRLKKFIADQYFYKLRLLRWILSLLCFAAKIFPLSKKHRDK
jgi:hypothetical protein